MPLFYKNQNKLEALAKKTSQTLEKNRLSDLMGTLFGGGGGLHDETKYLRKINTDAENVNTRNSDAWTKFATGKGVTGVSRSDQLQREFYKEKSF